MATKKSEGSAQGKVENEGAGEHWGKVVGPDIDESFHSYEFTDPNTGEPIETPRVVHEVPVGVNDDGSLKTEKMTESFAKPAKEDK